jgi:hypothetical protein
MADDPFTGTWTLNVAASLLPFAAPRSVTLHLAADEVWVALTEHSVSADGAAEITTIRARFDDTIHPVKGSGLADGFAVRRVNARSWKTRGFKRGSPVFAATLVLSPDGRSFREEGETTLSDGTRATALLLFEKTEACREQP